MQRPLVPDYDVEVQVKPEKIFAAAFAIPHFTIAVIAAAWAIRDNSVFFLMTFMVFAALGFYKYLLVLSASYYLTDQQLVIKRGVFTAQVNYLELYRIKDIFVKQSFWMKVLGLMNITLLSFDAAESLLILKGIRISNLPQTIRNLVQEYRQRNKVLTIDK